MKITSGHTICIITWNIDSVCSIKCTCSLIICLGFCNDYLAISKPIFQSTTGTPAANLLSNLRSTYIFFCYFCLIHMLHYNLDCPTSLYSCSRWFAFLSLFLSPPDRLVSYSKEGKTKKFGPFPFFAFCNRLWMKSLDHPYYHFDVRAYVYLEKKVIMYAYKVDLYCLLKIF